MDIFGLDAQCQRVVRKSGWVGAALRVVLASVAAVLLNCSPQKLTDSSRNATPIGMAAPQGCAPGRPGCACETPGASTACGTLVSHYGNYVTCSMGRSTCQDGRWGACTGDRVLTKSVQGSTLASGGIRLLTSVLACADPCDPGCTMTASSSADLDASRIGPAPSPGGAVTLEPTMCVGLQCQIAIDCAAGTSTTLTGTVFDPAGVNPLYGAVVYVPLDPTGALPPFASGASCDSCAGTGTLTAAAVARTGPDGKFVLTNVPSTDVAPHASIPLIVQLGKWRREQILPRVPKCTTTAVDPSQSRLPRNRTDGNGMKADLPKLAIATGQADPFECLLLKMGIDPTEFAVPIAQGLGPNRVDYYHGNGAQLFGQTAPSEAELEKDPATLMSYDAVILPCQGQTLDMTRLGYANNLAAYANAGGRIFATHESYEWLAMTTTLTANATNPANNQPNPFFGVARWALGGANDPTTIAASIDTTLPPTPPATMAAPYPKGAAFSSWLQNLGAAQGGVMRIDEARHDLTSVTAPSTEWIRNDDGMSTETLSFSFDTPVAGAATADGGTSTVDGGAGACGRVVFNDFHVASSDLVTPGGACFTNGDCGYNATCAPAPSGGRCAPVYCNTDAQCPTGYTCGQAGASTCIPNGPCVLGSECRSGSCTNGACDLSPLPCSNSSVCGSAEFCATGTFVCGTNCAVDSDCAQGETCGFGRCQGCYLGTDCASGSCNGSSGASACSVVSDAFPYSCRRGGALTPQEDALEFMLLDLTSCIAPDAVPPPPPASAVPAFDPASFAETFTSPCAFGYSPIWRELDWDATVPPGTSISFSVQTTDPPPDGGPIRWSSGPKLQLPTAMTSTVGPLDLVLMDTGPETDGGTRLLTSRSELLLTVTLTPTLDRTVAPTLNQWIVKSDCVATE